MRLLSLFAIAVTTLLSSCADPSTANPEVISPGPWRIAFKLKNGELPINAFIFYENGIPILGITNGSDTINAQTVSFSRDSLEFLLMPSGSILKAHIDSPELMSGVWTTDQNTDHKMAFTAEHGKPFRFTSSKSALSVAPMYEILFVPESGDPYPAVLMLQNTQGHLTGTFLTESGDYRYLEGDIYNNHIHLSTFDGIHAFLFEARIDGDSLREGQFYSSSNTPIPWSGKITNKMSLQSPENITTITDRATTFDFRLPNQDGDTVTWIDLVSDRKVILVEFMGSWCPNCMDANKALSTLKAKYPDQIDIIPIAFELTNNQAEADVRIRRLIPEKEQITYLFGGYASKTRIASLFPILSDFSSFPTILFIDKNRQIRRIYTGFYGPGTGSYYHDFMSSSESLLDELVAE